MADAVGVGTTSINRRQFLRYGFNTAAGVLTASLGMLGFAAILLPPGGSGGGDLAVQFWAKGREDEAWYGACLLYTSPSPRDGLLSRMPSSA